MKIFNASSVSELLEKWMQWLTLFIYMTLLITGFMGGWVIWLLLVIFVPVLRYPMLLYVAWIYYDRKAGERGERRWEWVRNWKCWKYHNDFFPAKLHKTSELPPEKNYLICSFPHGILCTGTFCAFGNEYGGFSKMFPGLTSYVMTLEQHFITPFIREYTLLVGALPASASCLNYFLGRRKGLALVLVVGGAEEAFYSRPGVYKLNVKKRKGFIKIAYKNGTSLVPSISFGEPDIYDQVQFSENSIFRKLQALFKRVTKIAPVMFYGQFAVVPFRKPLNIVVGKPIDVEKVEEPTTEQIDSLHAKFLESLTNLFESEKHKYIENAEETQLIFI